MTTKTPPTYYAGAFGIHYCDGTPGALTISGVAGWASFVGYVADQLRWAERSGGSVMGFAGIVTDHATNRVQPVTYDSAELTDMVALVASDRPTGWVGLRLIDRTTGEQVRP